jgi:hypothetical protein
MRLEAAALTEDAPRSRNPKLVAHGDGIPRRGNSLQKEIGAVLGLPGICLLFCNRV